jgi:hypothetical protein
MAKSILSPSPKCLNFIHRTARSLVSNEIKLSTIQIEELTLARRGPLGHYFEMLIGTLFCISPEIESTHKNVVVRDGKITLGEFDLLYKKRGHWYHLEMAIKFYLGTSDKTSSFNWYGPGLRDNLGRKCALMNNHQLKLTKYDSANDVLRSLSINSVESEGLLLGSLFHPFVDWRSKLKITPSNVSRNHANGWWMFSSDFFSLAKTSHIHYLPLMKCDWITSAEIQTPPSKSNPRDIKHPKMVAVYKQGKQNQFYEVQRGFIVPKGWGPKTTL